MARRAIISDIHSNVLALVAVLADIKTQNVDAIVCLGDICGYGPDPIECIDLIRAKCKWALCGNHDIALFMTVPIGFNRFAREAIEWQRELLRPRWYSLPETKDRWRWLESLAAMRQEGPVLYVHASPRDPLMEYVEEGDFADMGFGPSQKGMDMFEKIEQLCFCGHSHKPGVVTEEFIWLKPHELPDFTHTLHVGEKTLVNVGSVGQPRDNRPQSCYAIYDDQAQTVTFRRVPYDIPKEEERFAHVPRLSERLSKRLETGT